MYYADHEPPHFHVRYSGQKAIIAIDHLGRLDWLRNGRRCIARS
jgi:hypothetical protein